MTTTTKSSIWPRLLGRAVKNSIEKLRQNRNGSGHKVHFQLHFSYFQNLTIYLNIFYFFPAKSGLLFFHIQKIGSPIPDFFPA